MAKFDVHNFLPVLPAAKEEEGFINKAKNMKPSVLQWGYSVEASLTQNYDSQQVYEENTIIISCQSTSQL